MLEIEILKGGGISADKTKGLRYNYSGCLGWNRTAYIRDGGIKNLESHVDGLVNVEVIVTNCCSFMERKTIYKEGGVMKS